jgi:hypothetical protein
VSSKQCHTFCRAGTSFDDVHLCFITLTLWYLPALYSSAQSVGKNDDCVIPTVIMNILPFHITIVCSILKRYHDMSKACTLYGVMVCDCTQSKSLYFN